MASETRRIVPSSEISHDRHQVALWRLAAVGQYLYDTMAGDHRSSGDREPPMPEFAMEKVREAQRAIEQAIGRGQRARRRCVGGEMDLAEQWRERADAAPATVDRTDGSLHAPPSTRREHRMATAEHEAVAFVETFGSGGGMRAECSCGWESDPFRSNDPVADMRAAGRALDEHRAEREETDRGD